MIEREKKRLGLIAKYQAKRAKLKDAIRKSSDYEGMMDAQAALAALPRNSSRSRYTNRCQQCGRPHAVYKKFKLCRICLRQELMAGNVTGGRKSSW